MSALLPDASVLSAAEDPDDPHHGSARRLLTGAVPLATLDLAFYETTDVAVRSWHDRAAADRLRERVSAIADDGGLVAASAPLLARAVEIAGEFDISVYDGSCVAAAQFTDGTLVSCDVPDLVWQKLAVLPGGAIDGPTPVS